MNIRDFCKNLSEVYQEMSKAFSSTQNLNNLQCPSDCGRCCQNPQIEASILEMLPMALYLHDHNLTDSYLEKIDHSMQTNQFCIGIKDNRCHLYQNRPSICRMFGVSGFSDKHQKIQASVCKRLKELFPEESHKVINSPENHHLEIMSHWSSRLLTLDPNLLNHNMHINLALAKAIEKVELHLRYETEQNVRQVKELAIKC